MISQILLMEYLKTPKAYAWKAYNQGLKLIIIVKYDNLHFSIVKIIINRLKQKLNSKE